MKWRFSSWLAALVAALCVAPAVQAQAMATPRDLPSTEQAKAWIDQDLSVVEARRMATAAGHGAAALAAGSHEWTARLATQRRSVRGDGNSSEWSAQLERGIRIGGKAEFDRQLGDAERAMAAARVGVARHEAARALAELWLDAVSAGSADALAREQLSFAEANFAAVDKRKRAGDAAVLHLSVAETDMAETRRQASAAASQWAKAQARLRLRFPGVPQSPTVSGEPSDPAWPEAQWRERILAESDPLKIVEAQLLKAQFAASRARADRLPDPVVGIYTASEAFRNERVVGVSLSIPFGGTAREERTKQAFAEAEAGRAAVDRLRREIESEVAETYADAVGGAKRWRLAEHAATASRETARLTQRAYMLGEADLQSLLLARRQSLESARAAGEARAQALRAHHRLLIDAHLIWELEHD